MPNRPHTPKMKHKWSALNKITDLQHKNVICKLWYTYLIYLQEQLNNAPHENSAMKTKALECFKSQTTNFTSQILLRKKCCLLIKSWFNKYNRAITPQDVPKPEVEMVFADAIMMYHA